MKKGFMIVTVLLIVFICLRGYRIYEANQIDVARKQLEEAYYEAVLGDSERVDSGADNGGMAAGQKDKEKKAIPPNIIGRIMIPSEKIDYIILDKTTDQNLDISITKVVGPSIHEKGNLVIAGHNMKNGSLFGKLQNVQPNDKIILEEAGSGLKKEYTITETYIVKETDLTPLNQEQTNTILTLITCTVRSDERLIVRAGL
jgi:LPXTG-site transpeptidase (sortase) family protein